jgi:hypothetical protein
MKKPENTGAESKDLMYARDILDTSYQGLVAFTASFSRYNLKAPSK